MNTETGAAIVKMNPALPSRQYEWEMTAEQEQLIRDTFFPGAKEEEVRPLIEISRVRRLNPFTKQIHFVKRWNAQLGREVWAAQVGIDGFRAIAERTGKYAGQDEPEFEHDKAGKPLFCRVKVYRKDWDRPCVGFAYFSEYAQTTKDKKTGEERLNSMWARGQHFMLAKCAEAVALRKAFPEDLSGLYEPSEPGWEVEEREVNAPPKGSAKEIARAKVQALPAQRVEQTIEAPRPKPPIVDVRDGETEEQAKARVEEPPPHDEETGEVIEEPVCPWGKEKGVPLSKCSAQTLQFLAHKLPEGLEDPLKARYRAANEALLDAVRGELARRG